jgi:hypothetical protein
MKFSLFFCGLLAGAISTAVFAERPHDGKSSALKGAVILVIRHAEKPAKGNELNADGKARAKAYVNYFQNFKVDGEPLKLDYLFAAADSNESHRARLTIEPTSKKLGLAIDRRFENEQFQKLADEILTKPRGKHILICWHHGEIPQLVRALGADSGQLFPKGKWPDEVYDWVIQLRYDSDGRLVEAKRINENF